MSTIQKLILQIACLCVALWLLASWMLFQFNNPTANDSAFYRHFGSVVRGETLPQYQVSR